jgi:hypothetical protein
MLRHGSSRGPAPKLGEWIGPLTEILEEEATLPRRERRSTQRLFEELRGRCQADLVRQPPFFA